MARRQEVGLEKVDFPCKLPSQKTGRLAIGISWLIALVFAFSGIEHLRNPWLFLNTIFKYEFLNGYSAVFAAALMPVLQLTLATMLLSGTERRLGLWVSTLLFFFFLSIQIIAKIRGLEISCGCFGSFSEPISMKTIGLDMTLMFASLYCLKTIKKID